MKAREYVTLQVERTRGQLRASAFLKTGNNSLELRGKKLHELVSDLLSVGNKPIELIDASSAADADSGLSGGTRATQFEQSAGAAGPRGGGDGGLG